MEIELIEAPTTELTPVQRAAIALKTAEHEIKLRELVAASSGIVSVTNVDGRDEAHRAGMVLQKARTGIRATGKAARDDAQKFAKAVIGEEDRLVAIIEPEETRIFALRDAFDTKVAAEKAAKIAAERARVEKIMADIQSMKDFPSKLFDKSSVEIAGAIKDMSANEITEERFAEFANQAAQVRSLSIEALQSLFERAVDHEAFQARVKQERDAEAARVQAEREELARLRAEMAVRQAEDNRRAIAERERLDAERENLERQQAELIEAQRLQRAAEESASSVVANPSQEKIVTAEQEQPLAQVVATPKPIEAAPTLTLGKIGARLGFSLTADFLRSIGFDPAGRDRAAVLYHEADWQAICTALIEHIDSVRMPQQQAA